MNTSISIKFTIQGMRLAALIVCISALATTAKATTLQVKVVSASTSLRIEGVRVCVGTSTSPFKYGAALAGIGNQPSPEFTIPNDVTTFNITVSKGGYQGQLKQLNLSMTGDDVRWSEVFRLTEGSGGPTCNAVPAQPPSIPQIPIAINSFQINGGQSSTTDRIVRLDVSYSGTATHYQVSESSGFSGASWKELPGIPNQPTYNFDGYEINVPVSISSSTRRTGPTTSAPLRPVQVITKPSAEKYGTKTLYFRLKNAEFIAGKRSDAIELKPKLRQYFISGDELKELLKYAKEQGFSFDSSLEGESKCTAGFDGIDFEIPGMKIAAYAECYLGVRPNILFPEVPQRYTRVLNTTFFGARMLNAFWRMSEHVSFGPKELWDEPSSSGFFNTTKRASITDPSFTVEFKFTRMPQVYPVYNLAIKGACLAKRCMQASIQLMSLSLEGPEDDNWVDPNKKWKNAFRRQ
jgi:hypothetical protein